VRPARDAERLAPSVRVALGARDGEAQPFGVEGEGLARDGVAEQQQRAVARPGGVGAADRDEPLGLQGGEGVGLARRDAVLAGDAVQRGADGRMAGPERVPGLAVGACDRRQAAPRRGQGVGVGAGSKGGRRPPRARRAWRGGRPACAHQSEKPAQLAARA
jgi:hypothetical protein